MCAQLRDMLSDEEHAILAKDFLRTSYREHAYWTHLVGRLKAAQRVGGLDEFRTPEVRSEVTAHQEKYVELYRVGGELYVTAQERREIDEVLLNLHNLRAIAIILLSRPFGT